MKQVANVVQITRKSPDINGIAKEHRSFIKELIIEREVGNRARITYHNGTALWNLRLDIKSLLQALIKVESPEEMVKMMFD